jgi:hypothetical protein
MFKVLPSRKVCQMWRRDLTFSYSVHVFFVWTIVSPIMNKDNLYMEMEYMLDILNN